MNITVYGDVYITNSDNVKKNIRNNPKLTAAKKKVKSRDKVCQVCGNIGTNGHLEVHHIMPLSKYPELACDENNMITMCQQHHRKYHELYDKSESAETFAKFIRDYSDKGGF